jgi:phage shock protein A
MEDRYKMAAATADDWERRAKWALQKGDEVLAREALKRRKTFEVRENLSCSALQSSGQHGLRSHVRCV